jgi:hypothetical protein
MESVLFKTIHTNPLAFQKRINSDPGANLESDMMATVLTYTIPDVDLARLMGLRLRGGFILEELRIDNVLPSYATINARKAAPVPDLCTCNNVSMRMSFRVNSIVNVIYSVRMTPTRPSLEGLSICVGEAEVRVQVPVELYRLLNKTSQSSNFRQRTVAEPRSRTSSDERPRAIAEAHAILQQLSRTDKLLVDLQALLRVEKRTTSAGTHKRDGNKLKEMIASVASISFQDLCDLCELNSSTYFDKSSVVRSYSFLKTLVNTLKGNTGQLSFDCSKVTEARYLMECFTEDWVVKFLVEAEVVKGRIFVVHLFFFDSPLELRMQVVHELQRHVITEQLGAAAVGRALQTLVMLPNHAGTQFAKHYLLSKFHTHLMPDGKHQDRHSILRHLVYYRREFGRHILLQSSDHTLLFGFVVLYPMGKHTAQLEQQPRLVLQTLLTVSEASIEISYWLEPGECPAIEEQATELTSWTALDRYVALLCPVDDDVITLCGTLQSLSDAASQKPQEDVLPSITPRELKLLVQHSMKQTLGLPLHAGTKQGERITYVI